jgi:predicted RecA/RadA family phage recombinase
MNNQTAKGDAVNVTLGANISSGAGLLVGSMFGIAAISGVSGDVIPLYLKGVYTMPKVSTQAWTVGATIYWDNSAKNCTTTVGSNTKIGVAVAAAANPSSTGSVRLNGAFGP